MKNMRIPPPDTHQFCASFGEDGFPPAVMPEAEGCPVSIPWRCRKPTTPEVSRAIQL
jgi:hypothetical protein